MPGRLPTAADFPASLTLTVTPPAAPQPATNVLILLHGFGDTHAPFARLAQQLSLPETACVSLRGVAPLPDALGLAHQGFHWGDDVVLDAASGAVDIAGTPCAQGVRAVLRDVVRDGLVRRCGFAPRDVVLFGFGQGGTVALGVARELAPPDGGEAAAAGLHMRAELGGIVSVGGPLAAADGNGQGVAAAAAATTPVLLLHGSSSATITDGAVRDVKAAFANVEVHRWRKADDSMPANRDEMLPIMRFFARRLRSRAGIPAGAVEIT